MTSKKKRIIHSPEFKAEALKLAEKVGVAAAARQLSLHESQIYGWRKAAKSDTKLVSVVVVILGIALLMLTPSKGSGLMELDTELRDNICQINEVMNDSEKSVQTLP